MTESSPTPPFSQPAGNIESQENKEYTKEFFELQVEFAKKLSEVSGISLADALLNYTNFYRRFGLGRTGDPTNPVWQEFISLVEIEKKRKNRKVHSLVALNTTISPRPGLLKFISRIEKKTKARFLI